MLFTVSQRFFFDAAHTLKREIEAEDAADLHGRERLVVDDAHGAEHGAAACGMRPVAELMFNLSASAPLSE